MVGAHTHIEYILFLYMEKELDIYESPTQFYSLN